MKIIKFYWEIILGDWKECSASSVATVVAVAVSA